jgi:mono/diheme cytochrome c family protein
MPDVVVESFGVLVALTLMIMGAGALIGYVVVNHEPYRAPATQAAQTETPGAGGGRVAGANGSTSGGATTSAAAGATTAAATTAAATTAQAQPASNLAAGKQVFRSAGCVACHTLKDAGASGTVGPNLDQAKPPRSLVVDRVTNGKGPMPSFKGQLSPQQIQAVATYVSSVAGKG